MDNRIEPGQTSYKGEAFRGKIPKLGQRVFISPRAYLNGDVELGDDTSVWPGVVIRGDMHWIRVGSRTSIQDGSVLHTTHAGPLNQNGFPLLIGDQVTIGHLACLHGCTVGSQVLIGIGAKVLDGAVIEDQVVIAAGALVPPGKRLHSGFMYMGAPVQQVRPLSTQELAFFRYTTDHYVKIKDEYLNA